MNVNNLNKLNDHIKAFNHFVDARHNYNINNNNKKMDLTSNIKNIFDEFIDDLSVHTLHEKEFRAKIKDQDLTKFNTSLDKIIKEYKGSFINQFFKTLFSKKYRETIKSFNNLKNRVIKSIRIDHLSTDMNLLNEENGNLQYVMKQENAIVRWIKKNLEKQPSPEIVEAQLGLNSVFSADATDFSTQVQNEPDTSSELTEDNFNPFSKDEQEKEQENYTKVLKNSFLPKEDDLDPESDYINFDLDKE